MTIEDGTHSCSRNVIGKLILHTVQKPQNKESRITGILQGGSNMTGTDCV
jgi:hypothetical protein